MLVGVNYSPLAKSTKKISTGWQRANDQRANFTNSTGWQRAGNGLESQTVGTGWN